MMYNPNLHHRRSIRLQGYDYAQAGTYFVTLVVQGRECPFGEVEGGEMRLNDCGQAVSRCWEWPAQQYSYVALDEWVVMPNHLHGIVLVSDDSGGGSRTAPTSHNAIGVAHRWDEGGRSRGAREPP
ncbi:MAG: hypothetical protein HYX94_11830 [Chloroflexi bacterium]|nr:hypothetical protein [Chloroflexota bacterium]